jgi:hypothetical protein
LVQAIDREVGVTASLASEPLFGGIEQRPFEIRFRHRAFETDDHGHARIDREHAQGTVRARRSQ